MKMIQRIGGAHQMAPCRLATSYQFCTKRLSSQGTPSGPFDTEVKKKQRNRWAAAAGSAHEGDFLRLAVQARLMDRLQDISGRSFARVVDIRSGGGTESVQQLIDKVPGLQELVLVDTAEAVLLRVRETELVNPRGVKVRKVLLPSEDRALAGAEDSPLEVGAYDLAVSNLALHWVNDLPLVFRGVSAALKPDGAFLGSMLGNNTLVQLRRSFTLADMERAGGVSPHVSPMVGVSDLGSLLMSTGYALPTIDHESCTAHYPSAFRLMRELREMGESNAALLRRPVVSLETFAAAAAIYKHQYEEEQHVPATFDVLYFIGWTPDSSQPKPKERGSADHSFREIAVESYEIKV